MHQQHDPKTIIAKANAEAKLEKLIKENSGNIGALLHRHRGHATLMMVDGSIRTGTVKLATQLFILFDPDTLGKLEKISIADIADVDLLVCSYELHV